MFRKFGVILLLLIGGSYYLNNVDLDSLGKQLGGGAGQVTPAGDVDRNRDTIRIATFNIQVFGQSKLGKPLVMERLAQIVRQYDVVAIQEIRSSAQDVMPRFVELINADGSRYDFIISDRLGRTVSKEQYAFVYNTQTIETDRSAAYILGDPDDLLHREPHVGWFRTRGPPAAQAFTFSLVNIHTDPDEVREEVDALADAYRAIMGDDRFEDDVILLGDLNAAPNKFGRLGEIPGIVAVIHDQPTNTRQNKLYDNILFRAPATTEFTGRAGVFDMQREFNLTLEEALEISDHLPVWAEFSIYEGGHTGPLATQPSNTPRR